MAAGLGEGVNNDDTHNDKSDPYHGDPVQPLLQVNNADNRCQHDTQPAPYRISDAERQGT